MKLKYILMVGLMILNCLGKGQVPTITSFSPTSGPVGTTVTITGTNFAAIPTNNNVYFGGVKAAVISSTATTLQVVVPMGTTYQPISVNVSGLTAYSNSAYATTFLGGGEIYFNNPVEFNVDLNTYSITTFDIDGDGKTDIATTHYQNTPSGTVSILLNNATNKAISFSNAQIIPTANLPYDIKNADFDGDGKLDIITTSIQDSAISILRNVSTAGNPIFANYKEFSCNKSPYNIAIADFDNDGKPDVVVTNYLYNTISVIKNTSSIGNLSFAQPITIQTGLLPFAISAEDIDGDGKKDIAVTCKQSNTLYVYRNTSTVGSITFSNPQTFVVNSSFSSLKALAIGDIDGDNKNDIVVSSLFSSSIVSVFKNISSIGNIAFASKVDFNLYSPDSYSANDLSLGDFTGDGKIDIVAVSGNPSNNQVYLLKNSSTTSVISFNSATSFFYWNSLKVATGDFNNDGVLDFVPAANGSKVGVFRNTSKDPTVSNFIPKSAITGNTVTIYGKNFTGVTSVTFGGTPAASFVIVNSTTITAVVGVGTSGSVAVFKPYGNDSLQNFIFLKTPILNSFAPDSCGIKDTVTIKGAYFSGANSVTFGNVNATSFVVNNDSIITAIVGNGATGNVRVSNASYNQIKSGFVFLLPIKITSINPKVAGNGDTVVITGTNFFKIKNVKFGYRNAASFIVNSPTKITAILGNGASGYVKISSMSVSDSIAGFTAKPRIISIFPLLCPKDSFITISGYNFSGTNAISLGGTVLSNTEYSVINDSTIRVKVSNGSSGIVTVTTPGGATTLGGLDILRSPKINAIDPYEVGEGVSITATGTDLRYIKRIYFYDIRNSPDTVFVSNYTIDSTTKINFKVPKLQILTPSNSSYYTYTLYVEAIGGIGSVYVQYIDTIPFVMSFSPKSATIGSIITIDGANFGNSISENSVYFGDSKATIIAANKNSVKAIVPYNSGYCPIKITNTTKKLTAVSTQPFHTTFASSGPITANSFATKTSLSTGNLLGPSIVDMDGDGKLDLLFLNPDSTGQVVFYRNITTNNIANFATPISYYVGYKPYSMVVTDMDGDGWLDVVLLTKSKVNPSPVYADSLVICKNLSVSGSFALSRQFVYYCRNNSVYTLGECKDLNGDGKPDFTVPDYYNATMGYISVNNLADTLYPLSFDIQTSNGGILKYNFHNTFSSYNNSYLVYVTKDMGIPEVTVYKYNQTIRRGGIRSTLIGRNDAIGYGSYTSRYFLSGDFLSNNSTIGLCYTDYNSTFFSISGCEPSFKTIYLLGAPKYSTSSQGISSTRYGGAVEINGDAKLDFIIGDNNSLCLYENKSDNTTLKFDNVSNLAIDSGSITTYVNQFADLNLDGKPDMIVKKNNSITIFYNTIGEAKVNPKGTNPINTLTLNTSQTDTIVKKYNNSPYVRRHYDISTPNNINTATGSITLYFYQSDFTNYNNVPFHGVNLPSDTADIVGKSNLRVYQHTGTSTTSSPGTYSGGITEINPLDSNIKWNQKGGYWEVTFDVVGLGGYFIASVGSNLANAPSIYTIRGTIVTPNLKLVKNASINLTGGTTVTLQVDSTGTYNTNQPSGNYTLRPTKNNDIAKANGINTTDALFVQRHILGSPKLNSAYKIIAADVNGDKLVNATDVLRIKRLILGTDTTFTKGSGVNKVDRLWEFVDSAYQFPDTTNPFPFKDSISFTNLTNNKTNQTFIGVKLGDVNDSWNASVAKGLATKPVELVYWSDASKALDLLRIPINAKNFKELVAMQYTLHFDNSKYEFVGIENNKLNIDFTEKQATKNGNIAMLWTDKNAEAKTLEDDTELFTLVLRSKALIASGELELNNEITEVEAWDKDFNQHNIILTKQQKLQTLESEQWSLSPNPTSEEIKINLVSKVNKVVSFELTDAQGKAILKQAIELQKGNNNFILNLKQNGNITAGIYFLKAVGIEGENVKRIMVK